MLQALEQETKSRSRLTAANSRRPAPRPGEWQGMQAAYGNQAVLRMSRGAPAEEFNTVRDKRYVQAAASAARSLQRSRRRPKGRHPGQADAPE